MRLHFLGKGGSGGNDCPTLYANDQDSYVIIGWVTDQPGTVEIPHLLLGFLEPDTFISTTLADTGRGTFTVSGRAITDPETLEQMTMETYETAIEVPKAERMFFGAVASRKSVA
ncbi:hypothetical protein GFY24_15270 [Nocardia sp. SYP-A9097]|uniref:hypothetical protein n=1 Tax=Nocardia sp. SYP-A9097 TaxID=2663237 RepID=UPI00129BC907|nr:hypothetical protein [Nocardia sp. SYP-A9097]MRH88788.1 hypothetical protein [Nocardia sp. SYP-A9097]